MDEDPIVLPIDGILDLHTFHPREVKELVPEYLEECRKRGILSVRIIHGKGQGTLRHIVLSLLEKNPQVAGFKPAEINRGGWGATVIQLKP